MVWFGTAKRGTALRGVPGTFDNPGGGFPQD